MAPEADHRHCKVCGKVTGVGDEACSRACRDELRRREMTRRNYTLLLYGAIALIAIVFASSFFR